VNGARTDDGLEIEILNPIPLDQSASKDGNQMALANIRQRFELAYGTKATVEITASDESFSVKLRFPYEEHQV
jgi:LytS/YehU family sensor histidine kinase